MTNRRFYSFLLLFLIVLFIKINVSFSCYYENFNPFQKEFCSAFRDYNPLPLNINNLTLLTNYSLSNAPDHFILSKSNGKNVLFGLKIINEQGDLFNKTFWTYIYKYNPTKNNFEFFGSFYKGFIGEYNGNYFVLYGNPIDNKVYFLNSEGIKSFNINGTWFFYQNNYLFSLESHGNDTNKNYTLFIYSFYNTLSKKYQINFTSDELSKLSKIFVDNSNNIYFKYNNNWYLINDNNKSKWVVKSGYERSSNIILNDLSPDTWIINLISYSILDTLNLNQYVEPVYSLTKFNLLENNNYITKNLAFILNGNKLEIWDLDKKEIIKTFSNVNWFSLNDNYLFLAINNTLYYTNDFNHLYKLYDNVNRFYLYDLNNDGKSEILVLNNNGVLVFGEKEKPEVDYFVKSINFPEPYTTYSTNFSFLVCSKGYQVIPLNISVLIYNNATGLRNYYNFLDQYINANSCKNYLINYIPYKAGVLNITIKLKVKDSNLANNIFNYQKTVEHDFIGVNSNSTIFLKNKKLDFVFYDLNDNLKDGYENITINRKNCSFIKVDYNNDKIKDYLINCSDSNFYYLIDPYNKIKANASLLQDKNVKFYVGLLNKTNYFVILPWDNYTGYIGKIKNNSLGVKIVYVDYNLDGYNDYEIPISALLVGKKVLDFRLIGQDIKIGNYSVIVSNNNDKIVKQISIQLFYRGLFNKTESFPFYILDYLDSLNVTTNGYNSIQVSNVPYNDYVELNYVKNLNKESFSKNLIFVDDKRDFLKNNNKINVTLCDLKINKVFLSNNEKNKSYVKVLNPCNKSYKLIIFDLDKNNTLFSNETNSSIFYLKPEYITKNMLIMVYYPNILDKDYSNNEKKIFFDPNNFISINFENLVAKQYFNSSLSFNIFCLKPLNLFVSIVCNKEPIYNNSFFCQDNYSVNFNYLFTDFAKCYLIIKNNDYGINIKEKFPLKIEKTKEIKRIKIKNLEFIIIKSNNQTYAFELKDKKLYNICEQTFDENNFQPVINLQSGCFNIIKIKEPSQIQIIKINTNGLATVIKKGTNYIIYGLNGTINIESKAITTLNNSEKEKYGVVESNEQSEGQTMNTTKKFVIGVFIFIFLGTASSLIGYLIYSIKKKAQIKKKKQYLQAVYQEKLKKEKERKELMAKLLKEKQEKLIEEEAKNLLTWVRFLLRSYDEKEVYNYLIKKGYPEEVVKKALELYKKESKK